jgi:predicted  nucleic acid-binding Zn-ribbon protein
MGGGPAVKKVEIAHELQQVDSALDRARQRLLENKTAIGDRAELDERLQTLRATEKTLRAGETAQRDLELEIADLRSKLAEVEKKLYGGTVKSPKELESLNQDAAQIRRQIGDREDRELAVMDQVESGAAAHREASEAAHLAEEQRKSRNARLREDGAGLIKDVERLQVERESWREKLDAAALRTYDSLRRTRGGTAVSVVKQRTCQACRVSLPQNELQRARNSAEFVMCQSCGRILFVDLYS